MSRKHDYDFNLKLRRHIIDFPCETLDLMHRALSDEIDAQIEAESLGGPFDEEWVKDMRAKGDIRDTFEKLVQKCKATKLGEYYEKKLEKPSKLTFADTIKATKEYEEKHKPKYTPDGKKYPYVKA